MTSNDISNDICFLLKLKLFSAVFLLTSSGATSAPGL